MLKENSKIKVHMYDGTYHPQETKEIKTTEIVRNMHYGKIFDVKKINGKLGINWNTSNSPYISKGNAFVPFEAFAQNVVFEDIENGETYRYSNITEDIERV